MITVGRFIRRLVLPFLILCYSVIILRLRTNRMIKSSKPLTYDCPDSHVLHLLPYHVFVLFELIHQSYDLAVIKAGLMVGTTVATANIFLNPMLYILILGSSILSTMENEKNHKSCSLSHVNIMSNNLPV